MSKLMDDNKNKIVLPISSAELDGRGIIKTMPGTDLKISCKAKGKPTPRIDWFKNNQTISQLHTKTKDFHIKNIGETSMLIMRNVTLMDSGNYTCRAYNENGIISKWIYVHVSQNTTSTKASIKKDNPDFCDKSDCHNGKCVKKNDSFFCRCEMGYIGKKCNERLNVVPLSNNSEGCRISYPRGFTYRNFFLSGVIVLILMMLLFIILWIFKSRSCKYSHNQMKCEKETQVTIEDIENVKISPYCAEWIPSPHSLNFNLPVIHPHAIDFTSATTTVNKCFKNNERSERCLFSTFQASKPNITYINPSLFSNKTIPLNPQYHASIVSNKCHKCDTPDHPLNDISKEHYCLTKVSDSNAYLQSLPSNVIPLPFLYKLKPTTINTLV